MMEIMVLEWKKHAFGMLTFIGFFLSFEWFLSVNLDKSDKITIINNLQEIIQVFLYFITK